MYFLRKVTSHFLPKEKKNVFDKKKYHLSRWYRKGHVPAWPCLRRPSFQKVWRKYHISVYRFWERLAFIFRLRCKIIFFGKRNIVFPDNTRKIIFQRDFFGNTIFSGRLEKENMVFGAVKNAHYSCTTLALRLLIKVSKASLSPWIWDFSFYQKTWMSNLQVIFSVKI